MKEKLYKLFLALLVGLSLGSSPIAQNEILKMLETLSGTIETQVQELDDKENESEEIKKKKELLNYLPDSFDSWFYIWIYVEEEKQN